MPSVSENIKVLNGRGSVVKFSSGKATGTYAYREWNKETRAYRYKNLFKAKTIDEAIGLAAEAAIAIREEKKPTRITSNRDPLDLIEREEKLVKKTERLAREKKKKEYPSITTQKPQYKS